MYYKPASLINLTAVHTGTLVLIKLLLVRLLLFRLGGANIYGQLPVRTLSLFVVLVQLIELLCPGCFAHIIARTHTHTHIHTHTYLCDVSVRA